MRLASVVNATLSRFGVALTRSPDYISAKRTVLAAEREGLSVCDYVERLWERCGDTQFVVDRIAACGAFRKNDLTVLEIGTGTGRYLEKVLTKCQPVSYESYETARDWTNWLTGKYPTAIHHNADGQSLKDTATQSVDVVHAHGVFVYLPFLVAYGYWREMWRVVRNGGWAVFDIFSEACMDDPTIDRWLASAHRYPRFLSKSYVVSVFGGQGFSLRDTFELPYGEGRSQYLIFQRQGQPN